MKYKRVFINNLHTPIRCTGNDYTVCPPGPFFSLDKLNKKWDKKRAEWMRIWGDKCGT